jgi:HK97 family phage major capsid protein
MDKKFRKYLLARQKALESKRTNLVKRSTETEDSTELKNILAQLESVADELSSVVAELQQQQDDDDNQQEVVPTEDDSTDSDDNGESVERSNVSHGKQTRGFNPMGLSNPSDVYDSVEYRTAFMEFACHGIPMPTQYRANAVTTTTDARIPTTFMNEIIRGLSTYGNIYEKVRKLNIQGGVEFPILTLCPEATWIGETTPSEDKKIQANKTVSFKYFGVECKIAQTLLCNITTLEAFQELFVPLATEALVKAIEKSIFSGDGTTQPLGILNDDRIPTENIIELTEDEISSWSEWHKKVFAKMKKSYRTGEFVMAQGTFDGYIDGMVDSTGQPIGRVNYGIDGAETYRFSGKTVETVEDDILPSWENANDGDAVAVFIKWDNYAINSNLSMTMQKWQDYDTNEIKNKCIMVLDGKLLDTNGVIIIKKKVA